MLGGLRTCQRFSINAKYTCYPSSNLVPRLKPPIQRGTLTGKVFDKVLRIGDEEPGERLRYGSRYVENELFGHVLLLSQEVGDIVENALGEEKKKMNHLALDIWHWTGLDHYSLHLGVQRERGDHLERQRLKIDQRWRRRVAVVAGRMLLRRESNLADFLYQRVEQGRKSGRVNAVCEVKVKWSVLGTSSRRGHIPASQTLTGVHANRKSKVLGRVVLHAFLQQRQMMAQDIGHFERLVERGRGAARCRGARCRVGLIL